MSQGQIYHAIVYGKNAMGSYASQLDTKQRWQIVSYVKKIQSENGGEAFTMIKPSEPAMALGSKVVDSVNAKKADAETKTKEKK
jgi:ABC-type Fe3+/spermidine/putrescine transport system ATPase subunit